MMKNLYMLKYDLKGRYEHHYKHCPGGRQVTRLYDEKLSSYYVQKDSVIALYGGSSETLRLRKHEKKEKQRLESERARGFQKVEGGVEKIPDAPIIPNLQKVSKRKAGLEGVSAAKKYSHSKKSARRIRSYATTLYRSAIKANLPCNFITLTFINKVSDKKAYKCLTAYFDNWKTRGYK